MLSKLSCSEFASNESLKVLSRVLASQPAIVANTEHGHLPWLSPAEGRSASLETPAERPCDEGHIHRH